MFHSSSRIGNDSCAIDQNSIQNSSAASYILQNYHLRDCDMAKSIDLATQQPGINYTGTYGSCIGGANIDNSSNLLLGSKHSFSRDQLTLNQRPFLTVPYLGRGSVCPILEAQLLQGDLSTNKKTVSNITETSYIPYNNAPIQFQSDDDAYTHKYSGLRTFLNEGDGNTDYIRGGMDVRNAPRDKNL